MTKPAEYSDELLKLKRILGDRGGWGRSNHSGEPEYLVGGRAYWSLPGPCTTRPAEPRMERVRYP